MTKNPLGEPVKILLVDGSPGGVRLTIEALEDSKANNELFITEYGVEVMKFLHQQGKFSKAPRPDCWI